MADLDHEMKKLEDGDAWDDSDDVVEIEIKRPVDKFIPVRLPSDKWEALRVQAREVGVGPTTLARIWILEKLRNASTPEK